MFTTIQKTAELISMFLTSPTIILSAVVLFYWSRVALHSFKQEERKPQDWFAMGVCVGFLGSIADNTFWAIPWSLSFIDSDWFEPVFNSGVVFNIFFRQLCGMVAAYCHVRAAVEHISSKEVRQHRIQIFHKTIHWSVALGLVWCLVLLYLR